MTIRLVSCDAIVNLPGAYPRSPTSSVKSCARSISDSPFDLADDTCPLIGAVDALPFQRGEPIAHDAAANSPRHSYVSTSFLSAVTMSSTVERLTLCLTSSSRRLLLLESRRRAAQTPPRTGRGTSPALRAVSYGRSVPSACSCIPRSRCMRADRAARRACHRELPAPPMCVVVNRAPRTRRRPRSRTHHGRAARRQHAKHVRAEVHRDGVLVRVVRQQLGADRVVHERRDTARLAVAQDLDGRLEHHPGPFTTREQFGLGFGPDL
jgi:hypothetical protein